MSFSSDVKAELLAQNKNGCCAIALLSAIVHTAGSITINKKGIYFEIATENEALARLAASLIYSVFSAAADISKNNRSSLRKHPVFTVTAPVEDSEEILKELGILKLDEENHRQINRGIDRYVTEQDCCKISYLTGAFLCCGNLSIPSGQVSGYGCRFVLSNSEMADGIKNLLESFGISPLISTQKENYIVYIKESEKICDLLALLGASRSVLRLEGIIVNREIKNNTNRQTNCIVANIGKCVSAALRQLEAIKKIESKSGLGSLPPALKEAAEMRKKYPEASLEDIAALCGGLTKSGISHRMKKIIEIADKMRDA
jgi:hypothetical protein